ncbi:ATP-binding protein [Aurantibacter crassamenti]|uniref:AAA family ATPase n=1 Tax=Aurantibacter crassamenti TaxID=1837375 RepID=UPI00193955B6|nr:ATP-binding protein [Aurantibacter crassamenti]MBM1106845.1 ATP-binding protein [Aurantibacter crassamenti]
MNSKKIVITGGPATGKTSVIQGIESLGYICFHEYIRELTNEAKDLGDLASLETNPINSVADPLDFNRKLLDGRTDQYKKSKKINENLIFFDRGVPDVLAYMNFYQQELKSEFIDAAAAYQYDLVFLLPMWKEIFATDEERFESFEVGLKIQDYLRKSYTDYGHNVIEVPFDSIENRIDFILKKANN